MKFVAYHLKPELSKGPAPVPVTASPPTSGASGVAIPPPIPAVTKRVSKIVAAEQLKLEALELELIRVNLSPNEALFVKAPSGTSVDRLKLIATSIAHVVGDRRRFVLITDDLEFSIIRDETMMIAAWHGGPEC